MNRASWIGVSLLLSSCVSTTSVIRTRFSNEQTCPEDRVLVDEEGPTRYRARGCEKEAAYVCSSAAAFKGGVQCVQEGLPNPPAYREPEHPAQPPPDPRIAAPQ